MMKIHEEDIVPNDEVKRRSWREREHERERGGHERESERERERERERGREGESTRISTSIAHDAT